MSQEPGKCPICGETDNIDYGGSEPQDNDRYYEFSCRACGFSGYELYTEVFQCFVDEDHVVVKETPKHQEIVRRLIEACKAAHSSLRTFADPDNRYWTTLDSDTLTLIEEVLAEAGEG